MDRLLHRLREARQRLRRRRARRGRRGITLMEVMLSIAIVLIMATISWASVEGAIEMNDLLATGDTTTRSARVTLGRLRRELQLAYLHDEQEILPTFQTVFVTEDRDPDTLFFTTLAHQRLYRNSRECDQAEVTVWGERGNRDQGPGDILYHRESERIDQYPDEGGRIYPLAYNVRTFNTRFLNGLTNEWLDEWDSRNITEFRGLPRAVQIGLVLLGPDPDDEDRWIERPFLTTVPLEYADPVQPMNGSGLLNTPDQLGGGQAGGGLGGMGGAQSGGLGGLR